MKKILLVFSAIFLLSIYITKADPAVVISEYANGESAGDEWTELLVIGDHVDMRGWKLHDNSATGSWQPGVEFADVRLWSDLRRGTVIVIHHRSSVFFRDATGLDGAIEVAALDSDIFNRAMFGHPENEWNIRALNISKSQEIIQLVDSDGNHVHALAHGPESDDYRNISGHKARYPGGIPSISSVRIAPGLSVSSYWNGGAPATVYADSLETTALLTGLPNLRPGGDPGYNNNYKLWQKLREPEWDDPQTYAWPSNNGVKLDWKACESIDPDGFNEGYIITKTSEDSLSMAGHPKDGWVYKKHDMIGATHVVATVSAGSTTFMDNFPIHGQKSYYYRVYAYRYNKDDQNLFTNQENAYLYGRGRAYNQDDFAEMRVTFYNPPEPHIWVKDGRDTFCLGDTTVLYLDLEAGDYHVEWFRGGSIQVQNQDSLVVRQTGTYHVKVSYGDEEYVWSNEIYIHVIDSPDAKIYTDGGRAITRDTSIISCGAEPIRLEAAGGDRYEWYRGGQLVDDGPAEYLAEEAGKYYAIVWMEDKCFDTTTSVDVVLKDVDFAFREDTVAIYLYNMQSQRQVDAALINNSDAELTITPEDLDIPASFSIIAPSFPWKIAPNSQMTFTIRFSLSTVGVMKGHLIYNGPCDKSDSLWLYGEKRDQPFDANPAKLEITDLLPCNPPLDTTLTIINRDKFEMTFEEPQLGFPFEIIEPEFPYSLEAGDTLYIKLRIYTGFAGWEKVSMRMQYSHPQQSGDAWFDLSAYCHTLRFEFEEDTLRLGESLACKDTIETSVVIKNTGTHELIFDQQPAGGNIEILDLPISIAAAQQREVFIRVKPSGGGDYTIADSIFAEPCQTASEIICTGSLSGAYTIEMKDTFNLWVSSVCSSATFITPRGIKIGGDVPEDIQVSIEGSNPNFSLFVVYEEDHPDSLTLFSRFHPQEGERYYSQEYKLTFQPCGFVKKIYAQGLVTDIYYTYSPAACDFGDIEINTSKTMSINIKNDSLLAIEIIDIPDVPPFEYVGPDLPVYIKGGEDADLVFRFSPGIAGSYSRDIEFITDWPCGDTLHYSLTGRGFDYPDPNIFFYLPEIIESKPGEIFELPIGIRGASTETLNRLAMDSIYLEIGFDRKLVEPLSVRTGNINDGIDVEFEHTAGGAAVTLDISGEFANATGDLVWLRCLTLWGDKYRSDLTIDSIIIRSEYNTAPTVENGELIIKGTCQPDQRRIAFGEDVALYTSGGNPLSDAGSAIFRTAVETRTTLELFSSLGVKLATLADGSFSPGVHERPLPVGELNSGVYFLILRTGNAEIVRRIIITK